MLNPNWGVTAKFSSLSHPSVVCQLLSDGQRHLLGKLSFRQLRIVWKQWEVMRLGFCLCHADSSKIMELRTSALLHLNLKCQVLWGWVVCIFYLALMKFMSVRPMPKCSLQISRSGDHVLWSFSWELSVSHLNDPVYNVKEYIYLVLLCGSESKSLLSWLSKSSCYMEHISVSVYLAKFRMALFTHWGDTLGMGVPTIAAAQLTALCTSSASHCLGPLQPAKPLVT